MRFLNIRLQDFRNVEFAELDLRADRIFLLGSNGQGKSNLLEALGLVTALRSFRTQSLSALPRIGNNSYAAVYTIEQGQQGTSELEIRRDAAGRKVLIDGGKVSRLADFIGRFPVVPLSSGDLMILRGSPAERRRFLDLTFSAVDPAYYRALRHYHQGVTGRNQLLKRNASSALLSAFEAEIAPHAVALSAKRAVGVQLLRQALLSVYRDIAEADEGPALKYKCSMVVTDEEGFRQALCDGRKRDQIMGSTQKGPHRDDFSLSLSVGGAREYASDGQQRGLCVALRLAQARIYQARLGVDPVILADDVLGELDPRRKAGFWRACPAEFQIIATGTTLPDDAAQWRIFKVEGGQFKRSY